MYGTFCFGGVSFFSSCFFRQAIRSELQRKDDPHSQTHPCSFTQKVIIMQTQATQCTHQCHYHAVNKLLVTALSAGVIKSCTSKFTVLLFYCEGHVAKYNYTIHTKKIYLCYHDKDRGSCQPVSKPWGHVYLKE